MDPSFRIKSNGEIVSSTVVPVSTQGRTFSVRAQDSSGLESEMEVHLVRITELGKKVRLLYGDGKMGSIHVRMYVDIFLLIFRTCFACQSYGEVVHNRVKRRWSPPPFNIPENDVGPFPKEIEKVKLVLSIQAELWCFKVFTAAMRINICARFPTVFLQII